MVFSRESCRAKPRRYQARLEVLEDRTACRATITLIGATRFQDGMVAGLAVHGGNNYTAINLRSAIVGANNLAGPDTILLENGTYTMDDGAGQLFGQFVVSDPSGTLTIANGSGGTSTINAQGQSRVFLNQSGLTLSGLKIENGLASDLGGAIFNNGTLNITNCQFVNNEALGGLDGGPVQGGAIFNYTGRALNVQNSTFAGNIAQGGTSSVILGGTASAAGGAIFFAGDATFFGGSSAPVSDTILASTFVGNQASGGAGAVYFGFGSRGGDGAGGGIFAEAGSYNLNVINSTFAANIAQGGQGALDDGGNAAGGGLYLQSGGATGITGTARLVNDTIALNRATGGQGSGVLAAQGIGSGGGLAGGFLSLPAPKVLNTIVAKNVADRNNDVDGVFSSLGSNLIGTVTAAGASFGAATGDFVGSAATPLDPGLDPLGSYGGPTLTFRLSAGSFAADRGNSIVATGPLGLTTDQRGQSRRSGISVDIGAYEGTAKDQNKSYTLAQGTTLTTTAATSGLLAGYNNPLGKTVTVQLIAGSDPAAGKLTLNANGSFTYKPPSGFHGAVSFRFEVLVNGQQSDIFSVILNVTKTSGRLTL